KHHDSGGGDPEPLHRPKTSPEIGGVPNRFTNALRPAGPELALRSAAEEDRARARRDSRCRRRGGHAGGRVRQHAAHGPPRRTGAGRPVKPVGPASNAPGTTVTLSPAHSYLPKAAIGGLDDYHCFLLEPHLTQDEFVTSAVIKPQRATIVHHVILFEASGQNAADARRLNDASRGNGWTCFGGPGLSETHPTADSAANDRLGAPPSISAWVPGPATHDLP